MMKGSNFISIKELYDGSATNRSYYKKHRKRYEEYRYKIISNMISPIDKS